MQVQVLESRTNKLQNPRVQGEAGWGGLERASTQELVQTSEVSPTARFAMSYGLQDLTFHGESTQFSYASRENGMAMRASSTTDMHLQVENISVELTLPAEAVGLTAEDFANNNGQPFSLLFSLQHTQTHIQYQANASIRQTLRKPEDILYDLAKALREVVTNSDRDKSILVTLDREAMQALLQNADVEEVFDEIVALISVINTMRLSGGMRERYNIKVSGKGNPYIDFEEHTKIEGKQVNIDFKITITPPQAEVPAEVPAESAPEDDVTVEAPAEAAAAA